jgi:hypothetical protein
MKDEIIEVNGIKWLVKEAVSMDEVLNAIAWARVRGSVGSKHTSESGGVEQVLADVSRLPACPNCGSYEVIDCHADASSSMPETNYKACVDCNMQWDHQ